MNKTTKTVLIVGGAVVGVGLLWWLASRNTSLSQQPIILRPVAQPVNPLTQAGADVTAAITAANELSSSASNIFGGSNSGSAGSSGQSTSLNAPSTSDNVFDDSGASASDYYSNTGIISGY